MPEILLNGLDGSNLLGFLAAVGTLRILSANKSVGYVRMRWVDLGPWQPVILHARLTSAEELVRAVGEKACGTSYAAWNIGNDLTLKREEFRQMLKRCVTDMTCGNREEADFLAAFGCEIHGTGPKKDQISDTEFRTMSGAGHQHFLGFMREIAEQTSEDQVRQALFSNWDYADGRPSMRWDPADYRPHALRALDPSTDPIRTMRGANLLAIHALPLFPTVPEEMELETTGFARRNGYTEITWPIWTDSLDTATVSSLLASAELQEVKSELIRRRGVRQVFRARRFTEGKYRNFTPSRSLL